MGIGRKRERNEHPKAGAKGKNLQPEDNHGVDTSRIGNMAFL